MTWKEFAETTHDPAFISKLRKAVGLLALLEVLAWLLSCTILGMKYR